MLIEFELVLLSIGHWFSNTGPTAPSTGQDDYQPNIQSMQCMVSPFLEHLPQIHYFRIKKM